MREAVSKAIEDHRRRGIPLAIWRDGKAVSVPASELDVLSETPVRYRTKSHGTKA